MIKKKNKKKQGQITLMMVIVVPVILLGILMVHLLLEEHKKTNAVMAIAYRSSDIYLSRYNSFLFEKYNVLAYYTHDTYEEMVEAYCQKNNLPSDLDIHREEYLLSKPEYFLQAIEMAVQSALALGLLDEEAYKREILGEEEMISEDPVDWKEERDQWIEETEKFLGKHGLERMSRSIISSTYPRQTYENFNRQMSDEMQMLEKKKNDLLQTIQKNSLEENSARDAGKADMELLSWVFSDLKKTFTDYQRMLSRLSHLCARKQTISSDIQFYCDEISSLEKQLEEEECSEEERRLKDRIGQNHQEISNLNEESRQLDSDIKALESEIKAYEAGDEERLRFFRRLIDLTRSIANFNDDLDDFSVEIQNNQWGEIDFQGEIYDQLFIKYYFLNQFSHAGHLKDLKENELIVDGQVIAEIEYLLKGREKEADNVRQVRRDIFFKREAVNLFHISSQPSKRREVRRWTAVLPTKFRIPVTAALVVAWGTAESYNDVQRLMNGESIAFVKTEADWKISFNDFMTLNWKKTDTSEKKEKSLNHWCYEKYLMSFMLIAPFEEVLHRSMNLVEFELGRVSGHRMGLKDFSVGHQVTIDWRSRKEHSISFENQYKAIYEKKER